VKWDARSIFGIVPYPFIKQGRQEDKRLPPIKTGYPII